MSLAARVAVTPTVPDMDYYPFKRGGRVEHHYWQLPGMHRDRGQRRVPAHRVSPDEYAPSYHVVLDDGAVVAVRSDQVRS